MEASVIDLKFQGEEQVIAAFLVPAPESGFVLVESGPGSTVAALEEGIGAAGFELADLRGVLVTHVHLDHAGAAGELARRTGAGVWVHPKGARHLADPERLLASARKIYGSAMNMLWGTMEPVPAELLHTVEDGETVKIAGLRATAWHTPGHARHHVAWQIGDQLATGDVGGLRIPGSSYVVPPTPPPDIDIPVWKASLDKIRSLGARRLLVTHFGIHEGVGEHLDQLEGRLDRWWDLAEETLGMGGDVGTLEALLVDLDDTEMARAEVGNRAREHYRAACPMFMNASGLVRAWSLADNLKG
ncbi:MAG TPA: MBL fold metallo-hydrolase [Acidobacteria bacterium]|nr:MBL fold metallo-hydrolase [Acidobacteriota bacterium]